MRVPSTNQARWALILVIYVLLALLANMPAWLHGFTHEIQNDGADLAEEVWFLSVTPYALLHGHLPFFTTYVNAPYGVNLVANTTMFFPGLVLAPITFLWGPVATFNVLMVASTAGSAFAAFVVFRRWVHARSAAFAGGLLYGFSPYMVGAGYGHLFLLFAVFPPLILLLLDNILIRQPGSPWRSGVLLGLLVTAQFLTSTEVLASSAIMTIVGGLVLLVIGRRWVGAVVASRLVDLAGVRPEGRPWDVEPAAFRKRQARGPTPGSYATRALCTGFVVFASLCAFPVWVLLFGPQHLRGPVWPLSVLASFSSDLLSPILPTGSQIASPASLAHVANAFVGGDLSENGAYIGLPLVLVLLAMIIALRKQAIIRLASALMLVAFVFSLGPRLRVDGHVTTFPLPFALITHVPQLDNMIPARFSVYIFLFGGLVFAVGLNRLIERLKHRPRYWVSISGVFLAAIALVPLLPRWPYPITTVPVPAFFQSAAVDSIPPGSVLLTYPFPSATTPDPMVWQAEDGFRYNIPGGYVLTPGPGKTVVAGSGSQTQSLLETAYVGRPLPALSITQTCYVDDDLRIWDTSTIVVTPTGAKPQEVVDLFDTVLDVKPVEVAGSYVYYDVAASRQASAAANGCKPSSHL